ncbi:MAG: hypothetical protein JAZ11_00225 [Candidatus Thiodiazotropha lotti]|nr:hypothetical protein [Candidatus Thiodiazotropha lotti]
MTAKHYEIEWEGIRISIIHTHKRWGVIEHLEIRSIEPLRAPLPITDTGYESHYAQEEYLTEYHSPAEYVQAWLDYEAAQPEWQEHLRQSKQYSLF